MAQSFPSEIWRHVVEYCPIDRTQVRRAYIRRVARRLLSDERYPVDAEDGREVSHECVAMLHEDTQDDASTFFTLWSNGLVVMEDYSKGWYSFYVVEDTEAELSFSNPKLSCFGLSGVRVRDLSVARRLKRILSAA